MKKSFFLSLAALAALFFFSACSDNKDEPPGQSESEIACEMRAPANIDGSMCIELYNISSSRLAEMKAHCASGDFGFSFLGAGTLKSKCLNDAVYDCALPPSLFGFEGKSFYYGAYGEMSNGMCPGGNGDGDGDGDGVGDGDDDDDDDNEPNTCTEPSYGGEGAPLLYEDKTYKTVKIGCQTWMAENLNYETEEGSECYDDDPENCGIYGRLYTWSTALSVCPSGWHLPTLTEWKTLIKAVGGESVAGKHLKSTYGWRASYWNDEEGNGLDTYGFTALPGAGFFIASTSASWWSSNRDKFNSDFASGISIDGDKDSAGESSAQDGLTKSVRCIQDI
jgi:uncharacterized protein (TIGR02145 family)